MAKIDARSVTDWNLTKQRNETLFQEWHYHQEKIPSAFLKGLQDSRRILTIRSSPQTSAVQTYILYHNTETF